MYGDGAVVRGEPLRVALVEDHRDLIEFLKESLGASGDMKCVGAYRDAETAICELPAAQPDVVVMDVRLPGMSGIDCIRKLRPMLPRAQFLMLTVVEDTERIFEAVCAGATGYVLKRDLDHDFVGTVREIAQGGAPMTASVARKILGTIPSLWPRSGNAAERLSQREVEVLKLLAKGHLYKEIAEELGLSFHTIRTHVYNIYKKLHVDSRGGAIGHLRRRS